MSCCTPSDAKKPGKGAEQKPTTKFEFGGPAVNGNAYSLFDDGHAFRVEAGKKWYLYNDTTNTEIHVSFSFAPENGVRRPKNSRTEISNMPSKWKQCTVVVYPLETISFVRFQKSKVSGYRSNCRTAPLSPAYIRRVRQEALEKSQRELRTVAGAAGQSHTDEEVLYKCRRSGMKYVDVNFPPTSASLQQPSDTKQVSRIEDIAWRRPQDIIPKEAHKKIKLFRHGIKPSDIGQGQLGDCWLMCAVAVVASSTTMIKDMFRHPVSTSKQKKEQKAGGYRVYLNKCGNWRNVIVDSYLPTFNTAVFFGRSSRDPYEQWVSLLEKAYAKVHGSYASIIGGDALHALQDLTGFPVYPFTEVWKEAMHSDEKASNFFKDLLRYKRKGYLISLSTPGQDTSAYNKNIAPGGNGTALEERYRSVGLGTGHAYSVLTVRQFNMPRIKLVKIRNPWGTGSEWKGPWGKDSGKWRSHPFVRRSCQPSKSEDGSFWMEWSDVVQYFDGGGVCMVKKKWYDYRFRGKFLGVYPSFALKIEVKKKQKIFFTLSQKDQRLLDADHPEKLYKGFLIAVSCANGGAAGEQTVSAISTGNPEVHPSDSFTFLVRRDVGLEMELQPAEGPYYVVPRIMAPYKYGPKEYTLGMLSPVRSTAKGLSVSFVKLPDTTEIFQNKANFTVRDEVSVDMQFQYKKRGGVPKLKEGSTVFGARYAAEDFPFPY